MSDIFSRMNPFRSASPTKSRNLAPPHSDSRFQRRSEDSKASNRSHSPVSGPAEVVDDGPVQTPRPPISPPGRLCSTSHPSLGSLSSTRRKPAPLPLDLSLSRHRGTEGKHHASHPVIQHPSPGRGEEMMVMSAHDPHLTFSRPQTSHATHSRSQSHHLPGLSAFGVQNVIRPSSALDSPLPSSLRGQYLLDTHRSIELDRPVYTPIDRPSIDAWAGYERPQSAAAFVRVADVPVSAVQTSATSTADGDAAPPVAAETYGPDLTPHAKMLKSESSHSLSKSSKSKSLSKKPSILRSLAHHPSLSALRMKKEKEKKDEHDRHVDTPDLVGDAEIDGSSEWTSRENMATPTPGNALGEGSNKSLSLWGSVKRKGKKKEGGMSRVKSVPGLRMSSESSDSNWRSSTDLRTPVPIEPVPALPAQYAKSAVPLANAALNALVASASFDARPASPAASHAVSKDGEASEEKHTPQKQLRMRRGRSEDLSPAAKGLTAKYTSPNRHLSTPPVAQRIKPITPPRHSMPPGTGTSVSPSDGPFWDFRTRDPLPLHLHSRRMSVDSASDAEYNEDDYGDLPSRRYGEVDTPGGGASANGSPARKVKARTPRAQSPTPTSAATAGSAYTEDATAPCATPTLPPPPRSKTTTPYGARRKGSIMPPPMPSSASLRSLATKTPTSIGRYDTSIDTPGTINSANDRAESPFEVKFSPMVVKRMSLDAFGTSSLLTVGSAPTVSGVADDAEGDAEVLEELEELEDEYDETSNADASSPARDARSRSRSRSLLRTPHRREGGMEYEDPDSEFDMDSEASFDGTNPPYAQPFASGMSQSNTLEGWVGTQLTTIKEFPSTATLDYIPDIPDMDSASVRRASLVRSPGVVLSLAKVALAEQGLVRSPGLQAGLASDGDAEGSDASGVKRSPRISQGMDDTVEADKLGLARSGGVPFSLSEQSMSSDESNQSIMPDGFSMYRTPLPTRFGDGKTTWTGQSGKTAFFTPLSYPIAGHQEGDATMQSEAGEVSPCAGREPAKDAAVATAQSGEESSNSSARSRSFAFSSASKRLRIKHSSLPPIVDEGIDITVQHNEQVSALEKTLAAVKALQAKRDEQIEELLSQLDGAEQKRQTIEEGRAELEREVQQKGRQVSDSATSVRQMRQALSDNETAYDQLQSAHDELADRLATAQQAIEMAQAEKIDVQSEIQVLANGTAVMANRIRELEEELVDARAQSRSVAAERLWNRGELDGLHADLRNARREAERDGAALRAALAKVAEKDTLISLRESEVSALKTELQELKVKVIGLQRGMVEKDRTVEMVRDKVASKQFELDEMRVRLQEVESVRDVLMREKGELEAQLEEARTGGGEWEEGREELQEELEALRADLALKEELEADIETLDTQLSASEAQVADLSRQLEAARADLEAKSGDLSLSSGEVDQLHAELEAANEKVERLESAKARMERDHKRALGEAKWDVNEAKEQLKIANEKLQEALVEREMSSAATKDSASRLAAYLDEIERLEMELGTVRGHLVEKGEKQKEEDDEMEKMKEEIKALKEDKELLNIALESKAMEVTLLQRQLPKAAQGAAKTGSTTPKRKLTASTSRLSMNGGRVEITPTAANTSARLAKSAMNPPSAARTSLLASPRTAAPHVSMTGLGKRASIASIDDASDTSFASARSSVGALSGPSALRGGLKGNRRESSVMGPPSHIPTLTSTGRTRMQSLGMGRASTTTPIGQPTRTASAVLGDSTRQNRSASAMAQLTPSKIPTFAKGPLPRTTGKSDLAARAKTPGVVTEAGGIAGGSGMRRTASVSSFSSARSDNKF